jgi:sugar fermentation stimulation protein A
MVYLVQIGSAESVAFARDMDPLYGAAFDRAKEVGVEAFAVVCRVTQDGIEAERAIPVLG